MRRNDNCLIGLTILTVVVLHILAESALFNPLWSRVLDTAASLVVVVAIAYVALGKHANVSILSGSQRELAARSQQVSSVNLLGGTKLYLGPGDDAVVIDASFINILGGSDIYLPAGWRLEDHSLKLLGGVSDKRPGHVAGTAPTVRISGFILLGGVTVKALPQPAVDPVS
ncbi:MAG: hypothetical protein ACI4T4_00115 [Limosilactobacillus sp.]